VSKRLFVGNLSWGTTEDDLRAAFGKFGPLGDVKVITDRDTGKSRGFAFVTFENAADADKAIAERNGYDLDGRSLRVNEAENRDRSDGGGSHGHDRGGGDRRGGGGRRRNERDRR
jgi:RNA recognition motif-containing protein